MHDSGHLLVDRLQALLKTPAIRSFSCAAILECELRLQRSGNASPWRRVKPIAMNPRPDLTRLWRYNLSGWRTWAVLLISFASGSLLTARLMHFKEVRADSNRVFQLEIYHAVPGKVPALEERFRGASKLQAKYNLDVVGYWVPIDSTFGNSNPAFANTFVYLVAHASQEDAKKNWDGFHADPAFQEYVKSEKAEKLIEGVDSTFMRPADYSAMK